VGVILVGPAETAAEAAAADVVLPVDCTDDELCRACRLLAEVVRLRRREREAARVERELTEAAMTDSLTGLANRRAWDQQLTRWLADASEDRRFCLATLDLDRFKQVNDTHGHAVGDRLLQITGRAMRESLRHDDFVARLGGDEFGLLLWVPSEDVAAVIVERVRRRIAVAAVEGGLPAVTASAGFAIGDEASDASGVESLYDAADHALIAAKQSGRDRTCSYQPQAQRGVL
jgi:diguanylate cyclase (GGDEF)-like protein